MDVKNKFEEKDIEEIKKLIDFKKLMQRQKDRCETILGIRSTIKDLESGIKCLYDYVEIYGNSFHEINRRYNVLREPPFCCISGFKEKYLGTKDIVEDIQSTVESLEYNLNALNKLMSTARIYGIIGDIRWNNHFFQVYEKGKLVKGVYITKSLLKKDKKLEEYSPIPDEKLLKSYINFANKIRKIVLFNIMWYEWNVGNLFSKFKDIDMNVDNTKTLEDIINETFKSDPEWFQVDENEQEDEVICISD